jgi:hypothetical protein
VTEQTDLEAQTDQAVADLAFLIYSSRDQLRTLLYAVNSLSGVLDTLLEDAERQDEDGQP